MMLELPNQGLLICAPIVDASDTPRPSCISTLTLWYFLFSLRIRAHCGRLHLLGTYITLHNSFSGMHFRLLYKDEACHVGFPMHL